MVGFIAHFCPHSDSFFSMELPALPSPRLSLRWWRWFRRSLSPIFPLFIGKNRVGERVSEEGWRGEWRIAMKSLFSVVEKGDFQRIAEGCRKVTVAAVSVWRKMVCPDAALREQSLMPTPASWLGNPTLDSRFPSTIFFLKIGSAESGRLILIADKDFPICDSRQRKRTTNRQTVTSCVKKITQKRVSAESF